MFCRRPEDMGDPRLVAICDAAAPGSSHSTCPLLSFLKAACHFVCSMLHRRPEDMKDPRPVAICDAAAPGSDVAAAMSAALAAASLVFNQADPSYAARCLKSARNMYRCGRTVWLCV
jgi:hypothetical protein